MGLIVSFFSLIIGLLYWGTNISKEKRIFKQLDEKNKLQDEIRKEFQKLVVDHDDKLGVIKQKYIVDEVFRNKCDQEYKSVTNALEIAGDVRYINDKYVKKRLAPYVRLMKEYGKLPCSAGGFHAVFPASSIGDIKGCAILLLWFDYMVRRNYPQYYIVKYYDALQRIHVISWNIYVPPVGKDIVQISDLQGDEIGIDCIDL